jgi:hypothetical protein
MAEVFEITAKSGSRAHVVGWTWSFIASSFNIWFMRRMMAEHSSGSTGCAPTSCFLMIIPGMLMYLGDPCSIHGLEREGRKKNYVVHWFGAYFV